MAYKFTEKTNNKQQQTAYVLYMIISSYFHKSICNTKLLEMSLFLHYRDLTGNRQEKLEQGIIEATEKKLQKVLPVLSQMNCEVSIRRRNGNYFLIFATGFESVSVVVDPQGNYHMDLAGEIGGNDMVFA